MAEKVSKILCMKIVNDWNGWQRACSCICSPNSLFEGWSVGISPSIHEHEVDPNIYTKPTKITNE